MDAMPRITTGAVTENPPFEKRRMFAHILLA
jgi:hypothetical protein